MSSLSICRAAHSNTRCISPPGQAPHSDSQLFKHLQQRNRKAMRSFSPVTNAHKRALHSSFCSVGSVGCKRTSNSETEPPGRPQRTGVCSCLFPSTWLPQAQPGSHSQDLHKQFLPGATATPDSRTAYRVLNCLLVQQQALGCVAGGRTASVQNTTWILWHADLLDYAGSSTGAAYRVVGAIVPFSWIGLSLAVSTLGKALYIISPGLNWALSTLLPSPEGMLPS